jgi:N-acetylglucosaminyl-diphospho-decaprenol L-rhamnosyltransferase
MMDNSMDISVVLVSYNTSALTIRSLQHLFASQHPWQMEVIVVDNASRDDSVKAVRETYPEIPVIENAQNVGFGRANNQALSLAKGRYILLLNTDAFIESDTLAQTVGYMESHPKCGILGAKLLGEDDSLQASCRYFPTPLNIFLHTTGLHRHFPSVRMVDDLSWPHDTVRSCDWVPGCYYLVRREVVNQVGLFDPRYFMYCEEVDHCFATKQAGWEVVYYPAPVMHIGGQSAKTDSEISMHGRQIKSLQIESELLYFRKNHGLFGLIQHLLLTTLVDVLLMLRSLIRLESASKLKSYIKNTCQVWKSLFQTGLAVKSTR